MSLFSSIRMGANSLQANQIALQVAGQNISNANTPGYIREEVVLSPAPTQRHGSLLLGLGVEVLAVVQKIDHFLEERLRGAVSDMANTDTLQQTYAQLEGIIGELSDTDLSTGLDNLFASISEILNQPENVSIRNLAVLQGETLTTEINRIASRVQELRADVNGRVIDMAGDINRLVEEIRVLNIQIAETEGGSVSRSDAVGLRDQRLQALSDLAELIEIRVAEQPSGGVNVYVGGDYLVFEGTSREVEVVLDSDRGLAVAEIQIAETASALQTDSGELSGLMESRDEVLGNFLDSFDDFVGTMVYEFNKLYSGGQGLTGFEELTSTFPVDATDEALDDAGLKFTPVNGSFQVMVYNRKTGLTQTSDIMVDLNGLGEDMTLTGLQEALDAIDGISASTTADGKLTLTSTDPNQEFAFADDTSGVLAALGLNVFFSGSSALDVGIDTVLKQDPAKFAASRGGIGVDTQNAADLAVFLDRPLASQNNKTLIVLYDQLVGETTQGSSVAQAEAEGAQVFETALRGQKMATSGVNLDEEAVNMIAYQRAYQATAKYIKTLSDLLELLVQL